MKTRTYIVIACLVAFMAFTTADSLATNSKAGTYAYPFLKIPVGAKAPAMGGAYTGLSNDVAGLYFNPAGIAQVSSSEISGSYNNYVAGMQAGYLSYVMPWGKKGKLGVAFNYLNYGSTPRTDVSGIRTGEFGGGDMAISLSGAWKVMSGIDDDYELAESRNENKGSLPPWNGLSLGFTAKFVYESLDSYSSDALAVDLGILYGLRDNRTRIGLSASNLGFQLKGLSSGHKDSMPAILRAGVGHQLKAAPVVISADAVKPFDNDIIFAAGLNYTNFYPLEIRAGYSTFGQDFKTGSDKDNWGGLSFGFGLKLRKLAFDYAFVPYADLGSSHRVGISSRW
jgi:hypothetical protein